MRQRVATSVVAWSVVLLWGAMSQAAEEGTAAVARPNVLFIAIDDLNDWVGFLGGHPDARTPHLDALAARGRVFANAHCAVPVCSASRVSVMSGIAATTHGSYELGPAYGELPALSDAPTVQHSFKDHGYTTLAGGKVLHHGFRGRLAADIDRDLGKAGGPRPPAPLNLPAGWSRAWDWGAFPESDAEMDDFQLATRAAAALAEDSPQPFFMSLGFFRPHVPLHVPQSWFDRYDAAAIAMPEIPAADLTDVPANFQNINTYAAAPTHAAVREAGAQRSLTHAYLAAISFVDHCVGVVLDALDAGPHADTTIVVLWSDHGFHLGEKQHWAKRTLWEESTRVPLVFAGPGIKPGAACREAVSLLDLYPTLIDLCGLPSNPGLEGVSLVPQLADPAAARERPAITSSYAGNHSIRTRDWRLIHYDDGAEELYDHRSDPDEFHNLAADPAYRDTRDRLAAWLPAKAADEVKARSERRRTRPAPTP